MSRIKVGLIGCGDIAQRAHLPNIARHPGADLVAFADSDSSRCSVTAQMAPRAKAFTDYRELLAQTDLDAVLVCVPNLLHAEMAKAALERGLPVYLEKPLATGLDDAASVMEAWRSSRFVGMMGFNYRFNQLYREVRDRISAGEPGEPLMVRSVFSTAAKNLSSWRAARHSGGGVLLDLASHHLDLIRYFFNQEITEVFAVIESRRNENDTAWLQMRLTSGLMVQSFFSTAGVEEDSFEIYGDDGKLTVDRYRSMAVRTTQSGLEGFRLDQMKEGFRAFSNVPYLFEKMRAAAQEPSYYAALDNFLAAVKIGENRSPDFHDGYRNLEIIAAAERSAQIGKPIQLREPQPLARAHSV